MRRDPRTALLAAGACLGGLLVTGLIALLWPVAKHGDNVALRGLTQLDHGRASSAADTIARLCDPHPYAIAGLVLIVIALLRRRWRTAIAVAVVLVASVVTSEALKPLLATPRAEDWFRGEGIGAASWPSGHATAALALALCAVLVAPRRLRPFVALVGAGFAVAVGVSVLVLAWHFPSDVFGGFLVAALWTLLAVAALAAAERRRPTRTDAAERRARPRPLLWPVEAAVGALAGASLVAVALRSDQVANFASDHTLALAGMAVIAALAAVLAGGLERVLDR